MFVIIRKSDDVFIAVAMTREGADEFMRTSGWSHHARVAEFEAVDEGGGAMREAVKRVARGAAR